MLLREALRDAVKKLDPTGVDPGLKRMVVIGHSQGGLLTKMMAIHSGDRLFAAASRRPLDELVLSDETRDLLTRSLFVEPLPFVERVIFIATPHRGSFLTLNHLAAWVTRFVKLPINIVGAVGEVVTKNREALTATGVARTSVDNMNPRHHFIRALQDIPMAPGIHAHSIIAVQGTGPIEDGDDGVVKYSSAHIEGVESELVIRSGHSVQGHPLAVDEVRRVLRLHAAGE